MVQALFLAHGSPLMAIKEQVNIGNALQNLGEEDILVIGSRNIIS